MQPRSVSWFMYLAAILPVACGPATAQTLDTTPSVAELSSTNSLDENGLAANGIFQNGIFQNGIFQNGIFQNGVVQNGFWQTAVWQNTPAALEVLRTNPYAPQLLRYMYECAMTAEQTSVLDPDGPQPLRLQGRIGLAPGWGELNGTCDKSCQRWVTACLLARANAYGKRVDISLRAPQHAPQAIKTALAVSSDELERFTLREGAYYGNIFQRESWPPAFNACAAPQLVPTVTLRPKPCTEEMGPLPIEGICEDLPVCSDTGGELSDCSANGTIYTEVITVYLYPSIEVCESNLSSPVPGEPPQDQVFSGSLDWRVLWSARHKQPLWIYP